MRLRPFRAVLPLTVLWVPAACGDSPGETVAVVRDSVGVRIVELPAVSPTGAPALRLEAPAEGEAGPPPAGGGTRGRPAPEFSSISAADAAADGTIYVLDRREGRVTVLAPDGETVLRTFGRPGEGPGEFRAAGSLAVLDDGRVMVGERMPLRFHLFDGAGRHQRTVRLETADAHAGAGLPAGPAMADWGWPEADGVMVRVLTLATDPREPPVNRVLWAGLDGRVRRVLLEWPEPGSFAEPPAVFTARRSWSPSPSGGLHVTGGADYEIRSLDGGGGLVQILRRPAPSRPVTREERERALERFRSAMAEGGSPPELVDRVAAALEVAPELPAIHALWTDRGTGELWVGVPRVDPARGDLVDAGYHVYRPDGTFVGRAAAPEGFTLVTVRGRRLYGRSVDALGVPRLRVLRLASSPGSGAPAR